MERKKPPGPPPPPKINTGQAKQVDKSEPASGDVTTVRLPPSRSPFHPPFQPRGSSKNQDQDQGHSCHSSSHNSHSRESNSHHLAHTRGLIPPGYCNGCHPRHATVPRQTLEHQGASSFVLRHDLYASLVARRTFHMTHNRPIPLPTSCPLQHSQRPKAQGPRTATPNQSPASYPTSSSTSATTTATTAAITTTNTTGQPKTPQDTTQKSFSIALLFAKADRRQHSRLLSSIAHVVD